MRTLLRSKIWILSIGAIFATTPIVMAQTAVTSTAGTTMGIEPVRHGITGAPYSADRITETTQTLADGSHVVTKQLEKIYRDSEGRTRLELFFPASSNQGADDTPTVIHIIDPVAGVTYSLNPRNRSAHRMDMHPPVARPVSQAAPPTNVPQPPLHARPQVDRQEIGTDVIDGVRITRAIPVGEVGNDQPLEITSETCSSPELNLELLDKTNDPRRGETIRRVENLVRDEPSPELFQVPPDYTIEAEETVVQKSTNP